MSSPNLAGGESERKFILRREEAEAFIAKVATRLTLDCYDLARPVAYTRTTYLDTEDLAYFRSCDGPVARRVRVREYAAAPDVDQAPVLTGVCFLELKENAGPIRSKARVGAPPHVIAQIIAGAAIDPRWATTLEEMRPYQIIREALTAGEVLPRLTTWYRRASMSGDGGMVRVTLDEQIAFARPALTGVAGAAARPDDVIGKGPGRVLEVKYYGEPPSWLLEAIAGLPESYGLSKFRLGMVSIQKAFGVANPMAKYTRPLSIPSQLRVRKV